MTSACRSDGADDMIHRCVEALAPAAKSKTVAESATSAIRLRVT